MVHGIPGTNLIGSGGPFEALLDHAPFGIYLLDARLRIVYANAVTRAHFADVPGGIVGHEFEEVVRRLGRAPRIGELVERFRRTLETGVPYATSDWARLAQDGLPPANFEWRIERVELGDGTPGLACYFRDVSDRRHAEEARLESERFARQQLADLDATYSAAPLGMCLFDREFRFRRINQKLAEMNGVPVEAHLGRTVHDVVPAIAAEAERVFHEVIATRRPVQFELRGTTPADPDSERVWEEHWFPIDGADGQVTGVGAIVQDVTAQRAAQEALRDADRRKDEFVAILAHELRNPLAPVRNAAHALARRSFSDPELRHMIHMIDRQAAHMARLVDDLLDVSRVTRGTLALQLEPVEFGEIAHATLAACRGDVDARGHTLNVSLPDRPVPLNADRDRLIQVFCNLLSNAAKYTPAGGHLQFAARPTDGHLEVQVRDDGIGIPAGQLGSVFDMFTQLDRSLERQAGLGIGLTLARQLVELHRGTIEAHSEGPGRGSTFVVRLPVAGAHDEVPVETTAEAAGEARRVLVTDDNTDAAESLAGLLQLDGHTVRLAFDGQTALQVGAEFQPQVAFIDIGMPLMNGYELARRMRETPWGRDAFLIALTGWGQESDRERSHAAGFDAHLVKPAAPDAMRRLLADSSSRTV